MQLQDLMPVSSPHSLAVFFRRKFLCEARVDTKIVHQYHQCFSARFNLWSCGLLLLKLKFQQECVLDLVSCLISLQGIGLWHFSGCTIHLPLQRVLPQEWVFILWWKIKPSIWCSFYWGSASGCWNTFCVIGSWSKVLSIRVDIAISVNTYLSLNLVTRSSEAWSVPGGYPGKVLLVRIPCGFFFCFFCLIQVSISFSVCQVKEHCFQPVNPAFCVGNTTSSGQLSLHRKTTNPSTRAVNIKLERNRHGIYLQCSDCNSYRCNGFCSKLEVSCNIAATPLNTAWASKAACNFEEVQRWL